MDEIRETLQVIAKRTAATTSAAEAAKKAVEEKKKTATDRSKLIAKPNLFDYKSQEEGEAEEEEVKAFKEWSWVFEKYLSSVDEAYMKDLIEIHGRPNENFDMGLVGNWGRKVQIHQALWIVSFVGEGQGTTVG